VIIAVDSRTATAIRDHAGADQVETLPAFVAADDDPGSGYDASLNTFLSAERVVIVAAYGIQFLGDGRELYGVDIAVETFIRLARDRPGLRLAVFLARSPERGRARRHLARLENRLKIEGVADRAKVLVGSPLVPALRRNAVFIRPTRSEGDAVSVREALLAEVPVVASDVVDRPAGVITVPADDIERFADAVSMLLDRSVDVTEKRRAEPDGDAFAETLITIYRRQLEHSGRSSS
jgi:glycosyltransferase involved in cell wall biosynthesis